PILGKTLALLKQIAPAIIRVGIVYNPDNPNSAVYRRTFEDAAGPLGIEPIAIPVHAFADIEHAVANLAGRPGAGVFVPPDVTVLALRDEVVALLARRRLPAIYSDPSFIRAGGLACYGPDRIDLFRRSAVTSTAFCAARKPAICRSSSRPNTSSFSTSKPPRRSALNYRRRCSHLPTRWLSEAPRVHIARRRRGSGVAARGARAADCDSSDRISVTRCA